MICHGRKNFLDFQYSIISVTRGNCKFSLRFADLGGSGGGAKSTGKECKNYTLLTCNKYARYPCRNLFRWGIQIWNTKQEKKLLNNAHRLISCQGKGQSFLPSSVICQMTEFRIKKTASQYLCQFKTVWCFAEILCYSTDTVRTRAKTPRCVIVELRVRISSQENVSSA